MGKTLIQLQNERLTIINVDVGLFISSVKPMTAYRYHVSSGFRGSLVLVVKVVLIC